MNAISPDSKTPSALTTADINTTINHEPRILDLRIAERLGFERPRKLRDLIARNRIELEAYGEIATTTEAPPHGGAPITTHWLNESQTLIICMFSKTPAAASVRKEVIEVYMAWRRGDEPAMSSPELTRRTDGIARMLAHKVTGIEKALPAITGTIEALSDRVNALMLAADGRVAALEYVSVRELLDEAKAMQKRRNGINRKIGNELRARALTKLPPVPLRRCPHSGVWLFPRDFAAAYMAERGLTLVQAHNDRVTGQGVLKFAKPKKTAAEIDAEMSEYAKKLWRELEEERDPTSMDA